MKKGSISLVIRDMQIKTPMIYNFKIYVMRYIFYYYASQLTCVTYTLIYLFIYLFIYGRVGSLLLCTGFLQLWRAGATLCCGAQASHCSGFSCCTAWALGTWVGFSSCGTRLSCMWDLPGPGIEPVSPALLGRFLTTASPGKSLYS